MLTVEGLRKSFVTDRGDVRAVQDVSFTVEEGRFYTLLGPSGCGKTTTLRCLAGLERPEAGRITIDGRVVSDARTFVPPHERSIGMVFQSYAIWPHMNVFDNVAYPLKVAKPRPPRDELKRLVEEALVLVGLEDLRDRPAPQLSGGQQQRLAFARALVRRPKLLLLDEPLSNLDAKLRERMRIELRELQRRLRITTVYVTHDQVEALFLSHRIAVMRDGRIMQEGGPRDIYGAPASGFVADFVGVGTFVPAEVGAGSVKALGGTVTCPTPPDLPAGSRAHLVLRPENVYVDDRPHGDPNEFQGTLRVAAFLGDHLDCLVDVGGELVRARAHPAQQLARDQKVWIRMTPEQCVLLADDGWKPRPLARSYAEED